eukprot:2028532-Amphidinium_carterae.1
MSTIRGQMLLSQPKVSIFGTGNGFKILRIYLLPTSSAPIERMAWELAYLFNLSMDSCHRENGLRTYDATIDALLYTARVLNDEASILAINVFLPPILHVWNNVTSIPDCNVLELSLEEDDVRRATKKCDLPLQYVVVFRIYDVMRDALLYTVCVLNAVAGILAFNVFLPPVMLVWNNVTNISAAPSFDFGYCELPWIAWSVVLIGHLLPEWRPVLGSPPLELVTHLSQGGSAVRNAGLTLVLGYHIGLSDMRVDYGRPWPTDCDSQNDVEVPISLPDIVMHQLFSAYSHNIRNEADVMRSAGAVMHV